MKGVVFYFLLLIVNITFSGCSSTFESISESTVHFKNIGSSFCDDTKHNWAVLTRLCKKSKVKVSKGVKKTGKTVWKGVGEGSKKTWKAIKKWDDDFTEEYW